MMPFRGAGDDALMLEDHSFLPVPARWSGWTATLPRFAAEAVSASDITRPYLFFQVEATSHQVSAVRAAVKNWIRQVSFPAVQADDVVLAADEAISNATEHAYPDARGTLTLFAACNRLARAVRIIVSDHGQWRPPPADPGVRGRGLAMMEKLAQVFRLEHGPHGTTVLLGWSLPG
jgi:anti-sigma regulatory factor (Ser/Thr protein kinase)